MSELSTHLRMLGTYSTCFSHPFYEFRGLNLQRHKESSNHQIFVHGTYVILKTSEGFYLYSFLQITIWFYLGNSLKVLQCQGDLKEHIARDSRGMMRWHCMHTVKEETLKTIGTYIKRPIRLLNFIWHHTHLWYWIWSQWTERHNHSINVRKVLPK
jgi:hypothetical protein